MKDIIGNPLHLTSLNHISMVCRSVEESIDFYHNVLGFVPIRRPGYFDFSGAWLFGFGVGIHLLQTDNPESLPKKGEINPKDNHISFQERDMCFLGVVDIYLNNECESMTAVANKLEKMGVEYKRACVEEGGIHVDQLFFHDPDGFMIEICNYDNLPVIPLAGEVVRSCSLLNNLDVVQQQQQKQQLQQQQLLGA